MIGLDVDSRMKVIGAKLSKIPWKIEGDFEGRAKVVGGVKLLAEREGCPKSWEKTQGYKFDAPIHTIPLQFDHSTKVNNDAY